MEIANEPVDFMLLKVETFALMGVGGDGGSLLVRHNATPSVVPLSYNNIVSAAAATSYRKCLW